MPAIGLSLRPSKIFGPPKCLGYILISIAVQLRSIFCAFVLYNIKICEPIDRKASSYGGRHPPEPLPWHRLGPHWRPGPTGMHVALGPNNP